MVGLFDSGSGGLNTVRYVKDMSDTTDLVYLIDRQNAPYGIKTVGELVKITETNIKTLTGMGADRVLIVCCTASTVYPFLSEEYKRIAIPIISAVAKAARKATHSHRIGLIATKRTISSHAFGLELLDCETIEHATGELVGLIDGGLSDESVTQSDKTLIEEMLMPVLSSGVDTLILGCTHFPALYDSFVRVCHPLGIKHVINSALIGARTLLEYREDDERKEKWQTTEEEE